jgi:uncharacterized protein
MLFLASCATKEALPNFFLLTGFRSRTQSSGGTTVLVRRVQVPAYLARSNLVTMKGGMEVQYAPTNRWAEPLDQGLARAVGEDLSRNPRIRAYWFSPGAPPVDHSYDVWIGLERFEGNDNGEVVLSARWSVSHGDSSEPIKSRKVEIRQSGWKPGDYAGLVRLLSEEVMKMSLQIAQGSP